VKELKRRNPANLVARMAELNVGNKFVDLLPSEKRVIGWIEKAKALPPMIEY
jgi:hypothetical protein